MKKIKLTKSKYAKVDDIDYPFLSKFKWQYDGFYAGKYLRTINKKKTRIRMHRYLMNPPKGFIVHHINGDRLDNRKNNLRICTQSENQKNMKVFSTNRSGIQNIHWDKERNKWMVQKCYNGKRTTIGRFLTKKEAKKAYEKFITQLTQEK